MDEVNVQLELQPLRLMERMRTTEEVKNAMLKLRH